MQNIKVQLSENFELNIKSTGYNIIRCNSLTSFKILDCPDEIRKSTILYSFPGQMDGFCHIKANEILSSKIRTGKNIGLVINDSIEEKCLNGFKHFFINPVGVDRNGIESILNFIDRKFHFSDGEIGFTLFLHHIDYHSYFEDDSVIYNPVAIRKNTFDIKA